MSNKTLRELGEEYEAAAKVVKRRIEEKRKQLNSLEDKICSNEAYVLKAELQYLYAEYRDAKNIAEYLKNYYDPKFGKTQLFRY